MSQRLALAALFIGLMPSVVFAQSIEWKKYVIPETGANADVPVSIFTEDTGPPEGGNWETVLRKGPPRGFDHPVRSKSRK